MFTWKFPVWMGCSIHSLIRSGILKIIARGILSCLRDLYYSRSKLHVFTDMVGSCSKWQKANSLEPDCLCVGILALPLTSFLIQWYNWHSKSTIFKLAEQVLKARHVTFSCHLLFLSHTILFH